MIFNDSEFPQCEWLSHPGPNHQIVLSSRIRLARNLKGFPFSHWTSTGELARVVSICSEAIRNAVELAGSEEIRLEDKSELDLNFLLERHQISQEMAHGQSQRSVFVTASQTISVMVAEEDHLRLQVLLPGLDLVEGYARLDQLDTELSDELDFAFSDRFGYLTACPTNVGTGLRCSVMMHLPALVMTRQIQKMVAGVSQLGFTVRGPQGEGSEIKGNLFQISNQITLGVTEKDMLDRLTSLAEQIVDSENQATGQLLSEAEEEVQDRVWRAFGILTSARKLNSKETLELLSPLRFGVTTGIVKDLDLLKLNEMLLCTRPAHLQKREGKELDSRDRDIARAQYIQSVLKGLSC